MDWYYGSSVDELVVPKYHELSDRFPSPENWPKWELSESESFEFPNKGFAADAKMTLEELNFNSDILSNDIEMESSIHDKDQYSSSTSGGGTSDESLHRTAFLRDQMDYQLDSLAGFEQMDDIFLSSMSEAPLRTDNHCDSFCFEPEFQNYMVHDDNISSSITLDEQSISSDTHNMGNSNYHKAHAFSPSVDQDKVKIPSPLLFPCSSDQKLYPLSKASLVTVLVPSEHNRINEKVDEETSLEESVLQEMELVMEKLTDKTRICFRDALYRLARSSRQHAVTQNQNVNLSGETSPPTGQEEKMRPVGRKTTESETNTIDRAIANLMFNKMTSDVHDFPVSTSASFEKEANRPPNYGLNQPQIHSLPRYPTFSSDVEVPVLCQGSRNLLC